MLDGSVTYMTKTIYDPEHPLHTVTEGTYSHVHPSHTILKVLRRLSMPLDDSIFEDFRRIRDEAADERDGQKLRQLVMEINGLLDVIEERLAKLEGRSGPPSN